MTCPHCAIPARVEKPSPDAPPCINIFPYNQLTEQIQHRTHESALRNPPRLSFHMQFASLRSTSVQFQPQLLRTDRLRCAYNSSPEVEQSMNYVGLLLLAACGFVALLQYLALPRGSESSLNTKQFAAPVNEASPPHRALRTAATAHAAAQSSAAGAAGPMASVTLVPQGKSFHIVRCAYSLQCRAVRPGVAGEHNTPYPYESP